MTKQTLLDKQWLDRVHFAYTKAYPDKSAEVQKFIDWLYKQYGCVKPNE